MAKICDTVISTFKAKVVCSENCFNWRRLFYLFPHIFEPLFVSSNTCSPKDVLDVFKFPPDMNPDEEIVTRYFGNYIRCLQEKSMLRKVHVILSKNLWYIWFLTDIQITYTFFTSIELKHVLQTCTGNANHQGNRIRVEFDADPEVAGFSFRTCGVVCLSSRVSDKSFYFIAMKVELNGNGFTMP